jgi:hypothetical protein
MTWHLYPDLNLVNQKFRTKVERLYFYIVLISIPVKNPYEKAVPGNSYSYAEYSLGKFTIKCYQGSIMQRCIDLPPG